MQKPSAAIKVSVEEFTSPASLTAEQNTPVKEIHQMMKQNSIRHIPILDGAKVVGIISDRDIKLYQSLDKEEKLLAKHIMSPEPYCVPVTETLDVVAFEMSKRKIGSVLVMESDDKLYGIFTATDALNALIEVLRDYSSIER